MQQKKKLTVLQTVGWDYLKNLHDLQDAIPREIVSPVESGECVVGRFIPGRFVKNDVFCEGLRVWGPGKMNSQLIQQVPYL